MENNTNTAPTQNNTGTSQQPSAHPGIPQGFEGMNYEEQRSSYNNSDIQRGNGNQSMMDPASNN